MRASLSGFLLLILGLGSAQAALTAHQLGAVPLHVLPAAASTAAVAAAQAVKGDGPYIVAAAVSASLSLADGRWNEEDGEAVWRAQLSSPGATLLILSFDRFDLPPGAGLRLLDARGRERTQRFTAADRAADGGLTLPFVEGDSVIVELRAPVAARHAVQLQLSRVDHGFRDPGKADEVISKSGSCNIDVACSQGDAWRNQIRSTVRLQIPGVTNSSLCTGTLINNAQQNDAPLVLTADHCGITATNAARVVTAFNFQTSSCGGTPNGVISQTVSGSSFLADNARADFTLIRLASTPPSSYNVYLAGWDASGGTPASGASIHHPSGDEKRISLFSSAARRATLSIEGRTVDAWAIVWSQGITEPGSSGSALFNQSRRIVGQLSGGAASCEEPGGTDYYARFDAAYNSGLKALLDPANSGITVLDGKNPGAAAAPPADPAASDSGGNDGGGGALPPVLLVGLLGLAALRRRFT